MKKLFLTNLVLLPLLFGTAKLGAQVTMGADAAPKPFSVLELVSQYKTGTYGGLRLPQMNTIQRTALSNTYGSDPLFEGLMIYNDSIHCVEYWNATKWVSLCLGTANITLTPVDGCDPDDPFPADGTLLCTFIPNDDPPCVPASGAPYSVYLIMGGGYASLQITDAATAEFSLTFSENNTAYVRAAIVRVMNNCTNEYKEFVFTQDGAGCITSDPFFLDQTSTVLCGDNGAVIAWVTDPKPGVNYVWSLSGMAVHTGNYMQITSAGKYIVYAGLLGCTDPTPQTLTITKTDGYSSNAPVVTATNGGALCDGGNVMLTASNVTYPVKWFHNGVLCDICNTNPLILNSSGDAGEWFATQQDDPCGSRMSNIVPVIDETAISTTLSTPVIYANGDLLTSSSIVCKNGTVELAVHNADVYSGGTLFEWFDNSVLIASGTATVIYYNVPDEDEMNLWVQVSDMSGACPAMAVSDLIEIILPAPPPTVINNGASTVPICGASPATLVAFNTSGQQYQWFRDGVSVATTMDPFYQTSTAGVYTVRFEDIQGCWTLISPPITVIMSSPLFLSWNIEPESPVNLSDVKTYTVLSSPAADSYVWSSTDEGVAIVTEVPPGNTASVNYVGEGFVTIRVDAENACGPAFLKKEMIEVLPNCTPITSVKITPDTPIRLLLDPSGNPIAGYDKATFFADAVGGTTPIDYEWYVNSALQGATGSSFTYTATPSFGTVDTVYVAATNECTASDVATSTKVVILLGIRYDYTGSYQTFTAPRNGRYQIELWGARGGGQSSWYRFGAYTTGVIELIQDEQIYLQVGSIGGTGSGCVGGTAGYNGGAAGANATHPGCVGNNIGSGGGGATDVRMTSGAWNETTSLRSRIMVAAGAGGRGGGYGGNAGGLTSPNTTLYYGSQYVSIIATGASQTAGGTSFGYFGFSTSTSVAPNTGGGGGSGYYGGGSAPAGGTGHGTSGGAGGSSFISGHAGCNAINASGAHTGQPDHYSGKVFTNTVMIDGSGYGWTNVQGALTPMPNPNGGFYSSYGHTGNGVAIITYLGE